MNPIGYTQQKDYSKLNGAVQKKVIAKYDQNDDGALTHAELNRVTKHDHSTTRTHLRDDGRHKVKTSLDKHIKMSADNFKAVDANADGKLTSEEITDHHYRTKLDADGDRQIGFFARLFKETKGSVVDHFHSLAKASMEHTRTTIEFTPMTPTEVALQRQLNAVARQQHRDRARANRNRSGQIGGIVGRGVGKGISKLF